MTPTIEELVQEHFDRSSDFTLSVDSNIDMRHEKLRIAHDTLIDAYTALTERIAEMESTLIDRDFECAETWALVLSHEGHIEELDKIIAESK